MDRHTGEIITGWEYIFQSVDDLFTTRFRERAERRPYGSAVPDAIDRPINDDLVLDVFVAAAEAIDAWLSGIVRLVDIQMLDGTVDGKTRFSVMLERLDNGDVASYEALL
ncbi:MAG: hypothetical protein JJ926_03810 [Roseitalea sp.]|nr:hypothetical protein [Roseitalea sp.]MBO6950982.1 hypothetical protein [Rhizobiaceae bacterium]MBO6591031.1 hypothetical protein [Roseitalea sp.]MBO6599711.1 hypothetical protein [Roseitalea sp.]MBO6611467.1 hypothetical protein [Roseitalea sp.]